jgi:hypothetical protein
LDEAGIIVATPALFEITKNLGLREEELEIGPPVVSELRTLAESSFANAPGGPEVRDS